MLDFIAGPFAARIAGVWPAPHAAFLAAPAVRRHLACLALLSAGPQTVIDPAVILDKRLPSAIRIAVPGAPSGLARALERLGERAWSEADYRRLLALLAEPQTGKLLRHRAAIGVEEVRALARLNQPLVGLCRLSLSEAAAGLIGEAFAAIERRDGPAAAQGLAQRWTAVESLPRLVERVRDDVEPEPPAPPFPGTTRLRPLSTKAAIEDASVRFKNCLRGQAHWAYSGTSAYYEWVEPPACVLEITRDRLHGWTLDQARLAENKPVPEPTRSALITELRDMGVHVVRSLWRLNDALTRAAATPPRPIETEAEVIGTLFGDGEAEDRGQRLGPAW